MYYLGRNELCRRYFVTMRSTGFLSSRSPSSGQPGFSPGRAYFFYQHQISIAEILLTPGNGAYGPICLLTAFSCWFSTFCSDLVI